MTAATTTTAGRETGHVRAEDFRHRAVCRDIDPELFYPAAEDGPEHDAQVGAAKAVCAQCPARAECLAWALVSLPYGVAGGLTEQERHQARTSTASRGRSAAATALLPGSSTQTPRQGHERKDTEGR